MPRLVSRPSGVWRSSPILLFAILASSCMESRCAHVAVPPYMPAPSHMPAPPRTSVYNVLLSPTVSGSINTLSTLKPVTVIFYIGPKDARSAVPEGEAATNPHLVRDLIVTLSCLFCQGETIQKKPLKYDTRDPTELSSMASFTLVPDAELLRNRGRGDLIFQVTGQEDGVLYDNVVVPVHVAPANIETAPNWSPLSQRTASGESRLGERPAGARAVDLTITSFEAPSGNVHMQLAPTEPGLLALFGSRHLDGPVPRTFDTQLPSSTLATLIANNYAALVALIRNNVALLRAVRGGAGTGLTGSNNVLSVEDEKLLLETFHKAGKDLYRRLFLVNPELRALANELEGYGVGDRLLRVRIETQHVMVPWQFLHPLEPTFTRRKFWGFRYELIADPQGSQVEGGYPATPRQASGPIILAKYQTAGATPGENESVATLGNEQYSMLATQLTPYVIKVDTRDALQNAIGSHLNDVEMIVAFTHALNGTVLQELPDGDYVAAPSVGGPRLLFSKTDSLSAAELSGLPSTLNVPVVLMNRRPLVFLNGCETAGGGYFATRDLNFPDIFLSFGASGVIASEAPVWPMFAHYFSRSLLTQLKQGHPASLALLKARQEWLDRARNPLGLLYSYYGGVDSAVTFD